MEAKVGALEREESMINLDLKMATSSDLALPISFLFVHLPAELVSHLNVTHGVLVGAPTVL